MRGGFYYDLSKRVYRRVKSLPVLSLTASVSESVMEGVLSRTLMKHPNNAAGTVAVRVCVTHACACVKITFLVR